MMNQCPRCGAPRPGDQPICQQCGLDFRTVGAQPAPAAAAYQQAQLQPQPQPQAYQQPAPPPQSVPTVCPRCQAPLYPGYPICGNCGLDLRAAWGSGTATGPARSMLPIALAIGLVVVLLAAVGAVFVMAQPRGSAAPGQSVAASAVLDSSAGTGPTATPGAGTTSVPTAVSMPTLTETPTQGPGGSIANGSWSGFDSSGSNPALSFVVSDDSLILVTVAYKDTDGYMHMWMANSTVDVVNGSFSVSDFDSLTGQSGDSLTLTGTFTSSKQVSGTYQLTALGVPASGTWSAMPD
jgi:uncharacterized protein (DUF983 family)